MEVTGPFVQLRRAPLRAVATTFLRRRPWVVAPALAVQAALLATSGAPRVQVAVVLVGFALVLTFFIWESWRGRRALVSERGFLGSLLATVAGITMGVLGTGGIASPMLPVLFAPAVVGFAAFGRAGPGRTLLWALAAVLAALWAVPSGVPFPPLAPGPVRAMLLVSSLTALALLWVGVSSLSDAYAHAGDALAGAGEELLAWNVLGLVDILAVFLSAQRLLLVLRDERFFQAFQRMPFSVLPVLVVPLILLTHLLVFVRLRGVLSKREARR